jgi:hypothetical protein
VSGCHGWRNPTWYDNTGHVIQSTRYATAISLAGLDNRTATETLLGRLPASISAQDTTTYYSYDAAGRQRFMVDATGAVTETKYDAAGHVVETVQYANTVDPKNRAVRVAYTPNTNSSVHRNLGSYKAGDRVIAEVWFKDVDTSGMIFLGDTWGATPYSNAIYLTEYGRETGKS